jgi:hypothetical protein
MILLKDNYSYVNTQVKLYLELYPHVKRVDLANTLVQVTQAPILIVQQLLLDNGGNDEELQASFGRISDWYGDSVQ